MMVVHVRLDRSYAPSVGRRASPSKLKRLTRNKQNVQHMSWSRACRVWAVGSDAFLTRSENLMATDEIQRSDAAVCRSLRLSRPRRLPSASLAIAIGRHHTPHQVPPELPGASCIRTATHKRGGGPGGPINRLISLTTFIIDL